MPFRLLFYSIFLFYFFVLFIFCFLIFYLPHFFSLISFFLLLFYLFYLTLFNFDFFCFILSLTRNNFWIILSQLTFYKYISSHFQYISFENRQRHFIIFRTTKVSSVQIIFCRLIIFQDICPMKRKRYISINLWSSVFLRTLTKF